MSFFDSSYYQIFVKRLRYFASDSKCLKPEDVKETGRGIGTRITSMSWTNMKQYLREQRSKLNLTKVEQDNCQSEFMEGFREVLDDWNFNFYRPTVQDWFNKETDEAFKPYFQYGGYGY